MLSLNIFDTAIRRGAPPWLLRDPDTGGLPALDIDYAGGRAFKAGSAVDLAGLHTVSRASGGYAENLDGSLTWFGNNVMRRTDRGVLVEGARTNLLLQSQEFENAWWSKTRCSSAANVTSAPDGSVTADSLIEDTTAANTHDLRSSVLTVSNGVAHTFSVFAKANSRAVITIRNSGGMSYGARFNLAMGVVEAAGASVTAAIRAYAGGWWRCSITYTSVSTSDQLFVGLTDGSYASTSIQSYNGDGTSGIFIWGAQFEAAAFPSSYIPTGASSATRAADNVSVSLAGLPGWTAGQSLTLVTELYSHPNNPNSGEGGQCWLAALGPANSDGFGVFLTAAETRCGVSNTGDSRYAGYWKKSVARRISGTSNHIFCNGVKGSNGTNLGVAGDVLSIGQRGSNIRHLNGTIKRLTLFGRAISDAGCQGLSL